MTVPAIPPAGALSSSSNGTERPPPEVGMSGSRTASDDGFRGVLRSVVSRVASGDRDLSAIVDRGAGSAPIDSAELLRLQASVYRTSQELDLVARLVDKTTQAVKTTLQSQS